MPTNKTTNFASVGSTDAPALRFPALSGITNPGNVAPDAADGGIVIPIRLTAYTGLNSKTQTQTADVIPIINPFGGPAIGGKTVQYSSSELPKMLLEGYIDTPSVETVVGTENLLLPNVFFNGMRVTYADLITAYMEGRANLASINTGGVTLTNMWNRVNPTWFRDPFGRVYNNPKMISFTGGYQEQYPGRTTFQMTLQVPPQ